MWTPRRGPPGSLGCGSSASRRSARPGARPRGGRLRDPAAARDRAAPRPAGHPHRLRRPRRDPRPGRPARARPASRSAATARAAGPRSPCGSRPRPRRRARSSPGWTCRAASTRSRPSRAASGSSGSSSSPRPPSTRAWPSPARCSPAARWTCSSSTCPAAAWPPRTDKPAPGRRPARIGWRRSPGGRRPARRPRAPAPAAPAAWRPRSPSRPASGSSWPVGRGSGSAATSSASGPRCSSPATATGRRGGGRRSGSSTPRAASGTPVSPGTTSCSTRRRSGPIQPPHPRPPDRDGPRPMRRLHLFGRTCPSGSPGPATSEPFPTGPLVLGGQPWDPGPVLDANPDARALGVRRGMPLGSAHRLAPEATFLDPDPDADRGPARPPSRRSRRRSARGSPGAATRPTRRSACSRSRSTASSALWGPEPVLVGVPVERSWRAPGVPVPGPARVGIAGTRFAATVAAVHGPPGDARSSSRPVTRRRSSRPLPAGLLTPDPDIRARLAPVRAAPDRRRGGRSPRSALVARFGDEGARIHARARGEETRAVPAAPGPGAAAPWRCHRAAGRGPRAAPLRPPPAGRRRWPTSSSRRGAGRRPRARCASSWIWRSPGRDAAADRRRAALPGADRRRRGDRAPAVRPPRARPAAGRRRAAGAGARRARPRRPASSCRCSCRRPLATARLGWQLARLALTFGEDRDPAGGDRGPRGAAARGRAGVAGRSPSTARSAR